MTADVEKSLVAKFVKMFGCDTARISSPGGKHFLILGWNRNTKQDSGQWERNGEPFDFDYVAEKCIASGGTEAELIRSAKKYKRLLGMSWEQVLRDPAAVADEEGVL